MNTFITLVISLALRGIRRTIELPVTFALALLMFGLILLGLGTPFAPLQLATGILFAILLLPLGISSGTQHIDTSQAIYLGGVWVAAYWLHLTRDHTWLAYRGRSRVYRPVVLDGGDCGSSVRGVPSLERVGGAG